MSGDLYKLRSGQVVRITNCSNHKAIPALDTAEGSTIEFVMVPGSIVEISAREGMQLSMPEMEGLGVEVEVARSVR